MQPNYVAEALLTIPDGFQSGKTEVECEDLYVMSTSREGVDLNLAAQAADLVQDSKIISRGAL